jgi:TM2 domain-containing membrane protein YozV
LLNISKYIKSSCNKKDMDGQQPIQQKDWLTTLLLAVFLGCFGVHRFYTGHILIGVLQFITVGGCGIWALYDIIIIAMDKYTDANGQPLLHA